MPQFECTTCGRISSRRQPRVTCEGCAWREVEVTEVVPEKFAYAPAPAAPLRAPPPSPQPVASRLTLRMGAECVEIEQATLVGRNGDVFLARLREDLEVSREHCRLSPPVDATGSWHVHVLSKAGCRIDGRPLTQGEEAALGSGTARLALSATSMLEIEVSLPPMPPDEPGDVRGALERLLSPR